MLRRSAFTLVEILVVVSLIALLSAILLPALRSARESARTAVCLTNLHSIGQGSAGYLVANNFPPYFDDAITLRGENYAYSWSDFLVKGRYLSCEVNADMIPSQGRPVGPLGVYLAGMLSQRSRVFQCPSQREHLWGEVASEPVSYRADYVVTGHENSLPVAGVYRARRFYQDPRLIWMGEAFTTLGGLSSREYVRETQLHLDNNEVNPLRHRGSSTYLFADGHAVRDITAHKVDWRNLTFPWEPS